LDEHSLQLIEFDQVTAAVAARAACARAAGVLRSLRPMADREALGVEIVRLNEALGREREPEAWCFVAGGDLRETIASMEEDLPEGTALRDVCAWLEAGAATRGAWADEPTAERLPRLATLARGLPLLDELRDLISRSVDEAGEVRDGASPALRRLRAEVVSGEKRIAAGMERWARGFGNDAYVTRHADRLVAMVPAAGFPRRRAIVHDLSASGQSLLVEPLEWCGENNRVIEGRRGARDEERRVLAALGAEVRAARPELEALETGLVHLDTLRARARWARDVGGVAIQPGGDVLNLVGARHPLLAMGVGGSAEVVPLDLELHTERVPGKVLLVSGPNMGGKTVLLKTVGLAVAMAHAALPVTVGEGSCVPEMDDLRVDIGDEQSLERGLSTYAGHLAALASMAAVASPRTLLLADELGAGTDPDDGAALARALLEHAARQGAWAVTTTHLGSLKRLAGEVPGIENGSLEFDLETLTPRYRFLAGVPGASHALAVAERLGFPAALLSRAHELRPQGAQEIERLMADLAEGTRAVREEREGLVVAREQAAREAAGHHQASEDAKRELAAVRKRLTRESEILLARVRELWQTVQREARRPDKTREGAEALRLEMAALEHEADALSMRGAADDAPVVALAAAALSPGSRVRVLDLGVEAEIVSGPDREGRVQLRRGSWSIQSHVGKLAKAETASAAPRPLAGTWSVPEGLPLEVDLRGMDVGDAMQALDQGLDRAVLTGLADLRVIHGIGRGVLRSAVEKHLREHPQVAGQRAGEMGEGGRGVTVARLR
jgi:DNA mismatch repair protein MutS2